MKITTVGFTRWYWWCRRWRRTPCGRQENWTSIGWSQTTSYARLDPPTRWAEKAVVYYQRRRRISIALFLQGQQRNFIRTPLFNGRFFPIGSLLQFFRWSSEKASPLKRTQSWLEVLRRARTTFLSKPVSFYLFVQVFYLDFRGGDRTVRHACSRPLQGEVEVHRRR